MKIGRPIPDKRFLKGFTIYELGGHLGHVINIILISSHFLVPKAYKQNLVKNSQVVSEKSKFIFHM